MGRGKKNNLQRWIINMRMVDKRLDRQRRKIQKDEKKMMREIKNALAQDDMDTARLFAKDIARSRKMAFNLQKLRSRVKTMTFKLEQASAIQSIGMDLRGLVKSLHMVNRSIAIPQMEQLLFAMENEMENLNLTTETMEEGLEGIGDLGEGEETDSEADRILGEIVATRVATTESDLASASKDDLSEDLASRLQRLKGSDTDK
ncbi:MAG: Snf7 family protein [Candidatus Hodarchaeales archaeon]|jgi:charged multivesicular body protein 2A